MRYPLVALAPLTLAPIESPSMVELHWYDDRVDAVDLASDAAEVLDQVRFFVPMYGGRGSAESLSPLIRMPNVEVVQLLTAGYEHALPFVPDDATLCNAAGVHDASTAELAVGLILASLRGIDVAARDMTDATWRHEHRRSLADCRVVIIGAGGVGRAIAARLEPFETDVVLVGRTSRDGVRAIDELPQLLPSAEVVVLAVPLDDSTRGMVDADFLALLPSGALVVNVARGPVVDHEALLAETSSGRLLAALDVTDPEPLPVDHALWGTPGVLITPHLGGDTTAFHPRARRLVAGQLARWATGQPLMHVVSR